MSEQFKPESGATPETAEMLQDVFTKTENLVGATQNALKEAGVAEDKIQEVVIKIFESYLNDCSRDASAKLARQEVVREADIMLYFITGGMKPEYYGWNFRETLEKK